MSKSLNASADSDISSFWFLKNGSVFFFTEANDNPWYVSSLAIKEREKGTRTKGRELWAHS